MSRPDSLVVLRRHLRSGARVGPDEVARLLGVGERQARRVVRALEAGEPSLRLFREGRSVRYGYDPEDLALLDPPEPLTEDEALAVYMAAALARPIFEQTPMEDALAAAVDKLVPPDGTVLTFEPEEGGLAAIGPGTQFVRSDVFRQLRRAIRDRRAVTMTYTNARGARRTDYRCEPYGIVIAGGSWQLVGRDPRRSTVVRYALPDVDAVVVGEAFGEPPAGFDLEAYVRESMGGYAGSGEVDVVRLRVSPEAASSFRRKRYHPTQQEERIYADGAVDVSYEMAVTPDVVAFVRAFGAAVRVSEPASLAEAVAASARAVIALYSDT